MNNMSDLHLSRASKSDILRVFAQDTAEKRARLIHRTAALRLRISLLAKRTLDLTLGISALIIFSIPMVIIYLAVKMDGHSAFFSHIRIGEGGRKFSCYKFRTMCVDAEQRLEHMLAESPENRQQWETFQKLSPDPRITPIGSFLRRTSLDELPQLFNVLMGDMSLVGPRPISKAELVRYGESAKYYLICRPGITGLWQISGRNLLTYEDRVHLDALYARRRSLLVDIVIILFTIRVVIGRDGAI